MEKWAGVFKGGGAGTYPIQFFQGLSFLHLDDIIFTFRNYFTLCLMHFALSFAQLCYAFEEKLFFTATIILCKKVILRLK